MSTKLIWLITAILIIGIWFWMGSFWNLTSQEFIRMDLQTSDYNLFVSLSQNFFGFQSDFVTSNIINIWPILVVIFLTSLRKFRIIVEKNISHLILIVVSILLVYFGSLLNKSLFDKNNLFILIPSSSILLGSLCFASNRIYSKFFRFGSVILVVLGSFLQFVSSNVAIKEDPKSAFVYLNKYAKPNDLVLVMPAYSLILVNYYYNSIAKIESYPKWNPKQSLPKYEPKNTKNDIQIISSKYPKIFVVTKSLEKYESEVINELLITKRISKSISFDSTLKIIELSSY